MPRFPGMAGIEWFPGEGCAHCAGLRERWLATVALSQPHRKAVHTSPSQLLTLVHPLLTGGALYDATSPHSLGPVLTACGVHDLLPASSPGALPTGLAVAFDGRGRWVDATAAASFVAAELLPFTNRSTLALQAPTNLPFLADAIVTWRLAVVWMVSARPAAPPWRFTIGTLDGPTRVAQGTQRRAVAVGRTTCAAT